MTYNITEQAHQTVQKLQKLTIAFNDGVLNGTKQCAMFTAAFCVPTIPLVAYAKFVDPSLIDSPVVILPFMTAIFSAGATAGAGLLSAASVTLTGRIAGKDAKLGETKTEETHVYATTPPAYKWGRAIVLATALASGGSFWNYILLDGKAPQDVSSAPAPSR